MIASLQGIVSEIMGHQVTLDVQGVGYELFCSQRLIERLLPGESARVVVFTDVKQDSIRLFGFDDQLEKQVFLLLTEVKNVGPRTAAEIVSHVDKRELLRAIGAGDTDRLQRVKGIGKKTAERIVVELRDKVGQIVVDRNSPVTSPSSTTIVPTDEAIEALQALGFMRKDAEKAVQAALQHLDVRQAESSHIVKEALRFV